MAVPAVRLLRRAEPAHHVRLVELAGLVLDSARPGFVLVRSGEVALQAHDHRLRLGPGAVYVTDGREPANLRSEHPHGAELLCFWPDPSTVHGSLPGERGLLLPMVHEHGSEPSVLMGRLGEALLRTGVRHLDGPRPAQFWLNALLSTQDAWQEAIGRCHGRTHARRRELFVRLARARALLSDEGSVAGVHADVAGVHADIGAVAQVARLSTSHFVRLFHQVFGEPPHRFRNRRRMERALALVRDTALPIHEVMWRVGFDSHASFARAFRQHHGISATQLRLGGSGNE